MEAEMYNMNMKYEEKNHRGNMWKKKKKDKKGTTQLAWTNSLITVYFCIIK